MTTNQEELSISSIPLPPGPPLPVSELKSASGAGGSEEELAAERKKFSLFANIAARFPKSALKPTKTTVTRPDGTRYIENSTSTLPERNFIELPYNDDFDSTPCKVNEHVYIGSYEAAKNKKAFEKEGITHVLNAAYGFLENPFEEHYTYHNIELDDVITADASKHFKETNEFLAKVVEGNGKVLIHCFAGISRSATFTIAFLMLYYKLSLIEARDKVRAARPAISPNHGFWRQLKQFEKQLAEERKEN